MNTVTKAMLIVRAIEAGEGMSEDLELCLNDERTEQFVPDEIKALYEAVDDRNADGKPVNTSSIEFLKNWGVPMLDVDHYTSDETEEAYLTRVLDNALLVLPEVSTADWLERLASATRDDAISAQALCYLSPLNDHNDTGARVMSVSVFAGSDTVVVRTPDRVTIGRARVELDYTGVDYAYTCFASYICNLVVAESGSATRIGACEECMQD